MNHFLTLLFAFSLTTALAQDQTLGGSTIPIPSFEPDSLEPAKGLNVRSKGNFYFIDGIKVRGPVSFIGEHTELRWARKEQGTRKLGPDVIYTPGNHFLKEGLWERVCPVLPEDMPVQKTEEVIEAQTTTIIQKE